MKKSCFFQIQIFILKIFLYFCRIWSFVTRSRIEDSKSSQLPLKRCGRPQTHYFGTIHRRRKDEGLIVGRRGDWELFLIQRRPGWGKSNTTTRHCGIICRFIRSLGAWCALCGLTSASFVLETRRSIIFLRFCRFSIWSSEQRLRPQCRQIRKNADQNLWMSTFFEKSLHFWTVEHIIDVDIFLKMSIFWRVWGYYGRRLFLKMSTFWDNW